MERHSVRQNRPVNYAPETLIPFGRSVLVASAWARTRPMSSRARWWRATCGDTPPTAYAGWCRTPTRCVTACWIPRPHRWSPGHAAGRRRSSTVTRGSDSSRPGPGSPLLGECTRTAVVAWRSCAGASTSGGSASTSRRWRLRAGRDRVRERRPDASRRGAGATGCSAPTRQPGRSHAGRRAARRGLRDLGHRRGQARRVPGPGRAGPRGTPRRPRWPRQHRSRGLLCRRSTAAFGGHKGYGLSVAFDLVAGLLCGARSASDPAYDGEVRHGADGRRRRRPSSTPTGSSPTWRLPARVRAPQRARRRRRARARRARVGRAGTADRERGRPQPRDRRAARRARRVPRRPPTRHRDQPPVEEK